MVRWPDGPIAGQMRSRAQKEMMPGRFRDAEKLFRVGPHSPMAKSTSSDTLFVQSRRTHSESEQAVRNTRVETPGSAVPPCTPDPPFRKSPCYPRPRPGHGRGQGNWQCFSRGSFMGVSVSISISVNAIACGGRSRSRGTGRAAPRAGRTRAGWMALGSVQSQARRVSSEQ
jgi:hypothetical protein